MRRLETRVTSRSPIEIAYGSLDAFVEKVQGDIDAGTLDRIDMPIILNCIRRWHHEQLWSGWQR
ncbi:MAG: hypothetical protein KBA31_13065 [Alphaproteobacteria bacterium]|nr:hypothetical protein [Alphaproteobacteria bacterium]